MQTVGKREFTLHTSKYLKKVENDGEDLIITHQNKPALKLTMVKPKTLRDLSGLITHCKVIGNLNDLVFPGFDEW